VDKGEEGVAEFLPCGGALYTAEGMALEGKMSIDHQP